ncbi:Uma2 family endonuclease [Persephonella sp.]
MAVITKKRKKTAKLPQPKKFTVKEVEKLYKYGFFKPDEKIELVNGEIYKMSPIGLRHALVVDILNELFNEILHSNQDLKNKYLVHVQNPLKLSADTVLQPDVALVKKDFIKENRYPQPEDAELVVEVADTTLSFDKNVKLPLYAKAKIKEVWIINLIDNRIEVYTKPEKGIYTQINIKTKKDKLEILNKQFPVKDIIT